MLPVCSPDRGVKSRRALGVRFAHWMTERSSLPACQRLRGRATLPACNYLHSQAPVFLCRSLPRTLLLKSDDYWMLTLEITLLKGWAQWVLFGRECRIFAQKWWMCRSCFPQTTLSDVCKGLNCWNVPLGNVWPTVMTPNACVRLWVLKKRERRTLTVVGFGGVHRRVVVLGWGSDWCVVFGWAVHRCEILTVVLRYGDGPLLPQNVCKGPANRRNKGC